MRPEVAQILILMFVPVAIVVLAYRDWQRAREGAWPPPLGFVVAVAAVGVLCIMLLRAIAAT